MPAKTYRLGVFVELRKRLQTGLIIVGKDLTTNPGDVSVTGGDSCLNIRTPSKSLSLALPAGVTLEQGSCIPTPAGQSCGDELHFRLRITVSKGPGPEASDSVTEKLRAKRTYCFYCQSCMTRLLEDREFKRVLPLPNGNWNALVDDWCCHPDPFANRKLLPRADDCLLGDSFFLLTRDGSCEQTLAEEGCIYLCLCYFQKTCRRLALVSCQCCSSVVGEAVSPETLRLYITQVVVEPAEGDGNPEPPLSRSVFLERTIAARLLELSSSLSTFHFSVQTPDGKPFLLLWMLNGDSVVASVPETCDEAERSPGPAAASSCDPSLRAARALKLLYTACSHPGPQQ
uniref:E3 ubiquitin-protein ligase E3D n=1 Tax=Tetraodon nigroviridis TaxID=99883 RepID=H3C1V7_TETNG